MSRPTHGGNLIWAASLAGCPASLIVDFSASINPMGPPPSAIAAIQRGLKALNAYPDPHYLGLRSTLSQWHQLSLDWILPGNGSAELLTWACKELSQLDVTYLITPAFGDYKRALNSFSVKVKTCRLCCHPQEKITLPAIDPQGKAGLILNNPHNPTGTLFSIGDILPYLEKFDLVVVDEAFMDFLPPSEQQSLIGYIEDYDNLVILRSLTKFYSLPGLRLGYAIGHPDRLKKWQAWRDPWPVNILAALAGEAVLHDREFQQKTWDWLIPTRNKLFEGLKSLSGLQPFPGSANFLLVETEQPGSQIQAQLLKNARILIRDCVSFPELGDGYFRIAVKSPEDNNRLLSALKEVGE